MKIEVSIRNPEQNVMEEKIRENGEKIKQNKVLPYLVGQVVEVSIRNPTIYRSYPDCVPASRLLTAGGYRLTDHKSSCCVSSVGT
jgi:ATP-dependent 26S proteasome regulatory subunit